MNILLTGSEGFIASNIFKKLEKIHEITTIDKVRTTRENHTTFDIKTSELALAPLVKKSDIVIHCAANVGVDCISKDTSKSLENHIIDKIIIDNVKKFDKKIIYFSSSEVYGSSDSCKETDNLTILNSPRGNYALNKIFSERYIASKNLEHIIIRPFNIIGVGQSPTQGVIPKLIKNALENKDLLIDKTLQGAVSATPKRAFCSVNDLAEVILRMIEMNLFSRELNIFNVGNPRLYFKISRIAEIIKDLTESKSPISQSERQTEIAIRLPDISKLRKVMPDFKFNNDIKGILRTIIESFDSKDAKHL